MPGGAKDSLFFFLRKGRMGPGAYWVVFEILFGMSWCQKLEPSGLVHQLE